MGDYESQEQFKVVFDQHSTSSQPGSERRNANTFQLFTNVNDDHQKSAAAAEKFTMKDILSATCNWSPSNKIGQGGFGLVYKGRLKDGRMVAIKRSRMDQFAPRLGAEFRTEVEMLTQVYFSKPTC